MNFLMISRPSLMVFLLSLIGVIESITNNPAFDQRYQPFWQFVLRDFVYRTISSKLPDDALYKKLQEAPFYGGPLSEAFHDENEPLSRGSVYRMLDEQWILCQDDCEKCELCVMQKNPKVKWVLRRVRLGTNEGLLKWDLQLTILPELDEFSQSQQSSKWSNNYAYVMREIEPQPAGTQISLTTDRAIVHEKASGKNFLVARIMKNRTESPEMGQSYRTNRLSGGSDDRKKVSTVRRQEHRRQNLRNNRSIGNIARSKRRRSKIRPIGRPGPLAFYYPQEDQLRINNPTYGARNDGNPRLIMGIDQHGEKHLVHVVPIYSPLQNNPRQFEYPSSYRESYQTNNSPRISRTLQRGMDEAAYDKLIDRILNSLNTHRNFIETFLFSEILEPETPKEPSNSPYSSYPGTIIEDERFPSQNDDSSYRDVSSQNRANRYPIDSEYQVAEEQDQRYRRYGDTTREVNRPQGVNQDQSSMIEYEPYGMSVNDQVHDERSLPRAAEAERRRRNSRGKPTHSSSTFGHQGVGENHTQVVNNDSVFATKRKYIVDNSTDLGLGDSRLEINRTDSRIQNLSMESSTV